jgi:hypothetical protein
MHGHGRSISILSVVVRSGHHGRNRHRAFKPSSRQKALEIGADLVRQFFRYLEFDFDVGGVHLDDAPPRIGWFG